MPETETAAFRIVQEALTNVVKHAQATSCRIYLQRLTNTVLITIEDNGVGFDVTEAPKSGERRGLGLLGIRERVVAASRNASSGEQSRKGNPAHS